MKWKDRPELVRLVDEYLSVREIDMAPMGYIAESILEDLEDFLRSDGTLPPLPVDPAKG